MDSNGQTIFVADAHRDNGKRFIVHADEKLLGRMPRAYTCARDPVAFTDIQNLRQRPSHSRAIGIVD